MKTLLQILYLIRFKNYPEMRKPLQPSSPSIIHPLAQYLQPVGPSAVHPPMHDL